MINISKFFVGLATFWKSLSLAKRYVKEMNDEAHPGVVKLQIAYQRTRLALIKEFRFADEEINGSIVYLALAWQALHHSK
jgi:hypothetical protein